MLRILYLLVATLSFSALGFTTTTTNPFLLALTTSTSSTSICSSSHKDDETPCSPNVTFKYCTGCKWGLRSSWLQQELLSTFENSNLGSVSLQPCRPPEPGGVFIVTVDDKIVWDRKVDGGFPEAKVLKQRVRDVIEPDKDLGHSDVQNETAHTITMKSSFCVECEEAEELSRKNVEIFRNSANKEDGEYDVKIQYCNGCKWMLRANYLQMELFSTFQEQLRSITLIPMKPPAPGGIFKITVNDEVIWDRTTDGGFPETKVLKQKVRDMIDPCMNLGHSDDNSRSESEEMTYLSEEESQQMRNYFGVL